MQKTAIVVPCFNEEKRLNVEEFQSYAKSFPDVFFLFVDDCSTDDTMLVINEICKSNVNQMFSMTLEANVGKAEAVRRGFLKAIDMRSMNFENIGYWDADMATPLDTIAKLAQQLEPPEILIAFGSRVRLLNRKMERSTLRHYFGRVFATFASLVLNLPIYDTQCGAKIFRNTPELKTVFSQPFSVNWIFDVEIFARFIVLGKSTGKWTLEDSAVEYPLESWHDVSGSKLKIRDFLIAPFELFRIFIYLHFPQKNSD